VVLIPAGFAQCNYRFSGAGLPTGAEITLGLDVSSYLGTPNDSADDMHSDFVTALLPQLNSNHTLVETRVKWGPTATGPTGISTTTNVGGHSDDPSPSAVSFLVQKVTAAGGRSGRGRLYFPSVGDGAVTTGGVIISANLTSVQNAFDAFWTAITADDLNPVVLHGAGAPITTPTPITSFAVEGTVATQRRRQRR